MKHKKLKYKDGIENCDYLVVSKLDGREFMYNENNLMNIKGYLTKLGIKTKDPLYYFDMKPNPYKGMSKCHCRLCTTSYKDSTNYCGVLTNHITEVHKISVKQYLDRFPEESHLFSNYVKKWERERELLVSEDNRVLCPLCNKYFKAIKVLHTQKIHGMSLEEFVKTTGVNNLTSKKERDKHRDKYYSEGGLLSFTEGIIRESVKDFICNVEYHTYDIKELLEEGVHFIYKLTSPSGRCYIGRTINFFNRMYEHESDAKMGRKDYVLYRAIRKYGWSNFTKEIIDFAKDKGEASQKEFEWIEKFDSYNNGYNSTKKTEGGFDWSQHKGTKKYKDFITKIKKQRTGKNHYMYGKKYDKDMYIKKYGKERGEFLYSQAQLKTPTNQ